LYNFKINPGAKIGVEQPRVWLPPEVPMLGWYDASDTATIVHAAGTVSQWNDKSGNGQHLVQETGGYQPETGIRTLNDLNILDFDGTDWMSKSLFNLGTSGNLAFFMVAVIDLINNADDSLYSIEQSGGTPSFQLESADASAFYGNIDTARNTDSSGNLFLSGGPFTDSSIFNVNFNRSARVTNVYVDGTKRTNNGYYKTSLPANTELIMFRNRNANNKRSPDGAVAEFIITSDVSDDTRLKMEGYLANKWGIASRLPVNHPYKSVSPVTAGSNGFEAYGKIGFKTTLILGPTALSVVSFSPVDYATGVSLNPSFTIIYNRPIVLGSSSTLLVRSVNDHVIVTSLTPDDIAYLTVNGSQLTFTMKQNLVNNTEYYITMDSGFVVAVDNGAPSPEIDTYDNTPWNFTTVSV
jgi:hypothetical protein